ncbi:hypothetical protein B0T26DRAFT_706259 [Lasiosphaeria miniovina]|uniref:FAD-binding domain-containing protein n=1 Tax=Lasiosphaeria miniovina TaxID=1954250 RepID=A0AA40AWS1_9PEZI|nr:uncharacterized protein B0T26DRAFT_706259 [Lasiosphaeria miniovina]KAK0723361.1 hypothetical protein B0T26DRAFT_706259 [Lasiosphaeria miniovina]
MKIIIIGAGFSGVSTYLLLRRMLPPPEHTITLYDAHDPRAVRLRSGRDGLASPEEATRDSAATVGNIISLEPPAVRLLRFIDHKLYDTFKARSYVNRHYTLRSARGHTLAVIPTADGKLPAEHTLSCPRFDSWQWLHEHVGYDDSVCYRRATEVDLARGRPVVHFADGSRDDADLVVGADGVRSVVKKALFGHEDESSYGPAFEGFLGVGGFVDMDLPTSVTDLESMVFTFGPAGSFGYCSAAAPEQRRVAWWSNWGSPNAPAGNTVLEASTIKEQLLDRHATWRDAAINDIIQCSSTDRVYPVWTTPDLPHWGQRGSVLLGDAAHTLQATSGSGANQALEDAVVFSLLLSHYMTTSDGARHVPRDVADMASKALYEIRAPRVAELRLRSRNLYVTNKRINSVVLEYLWYLWIFVQTHVSFASKFLSFMC